MIAFKCAHFAKAAIHVATYHGLSLQGNRSVRPDGSCKRRRHYFEEHPTTGKGSRSQRLRSPPAPGYLALTQPLKGPTAPRLCGVRRGKQTLLNSLSWRSIIINNRNNTNINDNSNNNSKSISNSSSNSNCCSATSGRCRVAYLDL